MEAPPRCCVSAQRAEATGACCAKAGLEESALRESVAKMIGDESRGGETDGGDEMDGLAERLQQETSEARE